MNSPDLFIISERRHTYKAQEWAKKGATIVCLDFLAGRLLHQKNIPFISREDIIDGDSGQTLWWELSHRIACGWYHIRSMEFFTYANIQLAEVSRASLQEYLGRLFYYVRIFMNLKKKYPQGTWYFPTPEALDPEHLFSLKSFMPWAIVDAARVLGIDLHVAGAHQVPVRYVFPRPSWKSYLFKIYNFCVGLLPAKPLKIYTTAYWTYLEPVEPFLTDTELLILESKHVLGIGWRKILSHRIRIQSPCGEVKRSENREIETIVDGYRREWIQARPEVGRYLQAIRDDFEWEPLLKVFDHFITYSARSIADIRALQSIMMKEKPDVTLQMVRFGKPYNYPLLMARCASALGIPSIELQHSSANVDPRSMGFRIQTDYFACYGINVREFQERAGQDSKRIIPVGSPRFDEYLKGRTEAMARGKALYATLGLDPNRPTLLVIVPFSDTFSSALDSYELAQFFRDVRAAQMRVTGLQVVFKFRSNRHIGGMRDYLAELFEKDYAITGDEELFALLCASDGAVCNNTTTIYQVLLADKPLILYGWKEYDIYQAEVYRHAAPIAENARNFSVLVERLFKEPQYRVSRLREQEEFLKKYSFDGHSSERVAALLRQIGTTGHP